MEKKQTAVEWLVEQIKSDQNQKSLSASEWMQVINQAKQMEKEQSITDENTSDGYHTFKQLYDIRLAYNVALFNEWYAQSKYDVHKSLRHNDGTLCFGGGWFIVCADTPYGQISNHYPISEWDWFKITSTDTAKYKFDGHTTEDVISRLINL